MSFFNSLVLSGRKGFKVRWTPALKRGCSDTRNVRPTTVLYLAAEEGISRPRREPSVTTVAPDRTRRAGQHSNRINEEYRLCFRWAEKGAEDVEIVDYH